MRNNTNTKIDMIIAILGGAITIFSFMMLAQLFVMSSNFMGPLKSVWLKYIPVMTAIGLSYTLFGLRFKRLKKNRLLIHIGFSIVSWIWLLFYIIALDKTNTGPAEKIEQYFYYGGLILAILLMVIPQYLIGRKIYLLEKNKMIRE
ncbi:MAG: hypothetical protein K9H84_06305 [Bacteroidales bacterium]|nr:hypothetical protein [Bacteroidales bacterium]